MPSPKLSPARRVAVGGLIVTLVAALAACTGGPGDAPSSGAGTSAGPVIAGTADGATADVAAAQGDSAATPEAADVLTVPTAEAIAAAGAAATDAATGAAVAPDGDVADSTGDPAAVAEALVDTIYGPDPGAANAATAELLRRSGLPLVTIHGDIVAMPDGLVAVNEPVYVELVPSLAGALRAGAMYAVSDVTDLLLALEVTPEQWPDALLVATLAQWGKTDGAPHESRIAGAAVRASAWHRDQLLVPSADDLTIDPLAQLLLLAHLGAQAYEPASAAGGEAGDRAPGLRAPGAAFVTAGSGLVTAGSGLVTAGSTFCEAIDEWMTDNPELAGTVDKERDMVLEKAIETAAEVAADGLSELGGKIKGTIGKIGAALIGPLGTLVGMATKIVGIAMLLDGIRGEIVDDKAGYLHFKHPNEPGEDGTYGPWRARLRGTVSFVSPIPDEQIGCYGLAGIKVPHTGPLKGSDGYRASWNLALGTSKLMYVARKDSQKSVDSVLLDESGHTSTIEAYTKWEKWPEGQKDVDGLAIRTERTQVKIIVSKSRVNNSIWDWVEALSSNALLWDYAIAKLLPNFIRMFPVEFHVPDQYVIRGAGYVGIPIVGDLTMSTDLVSCQGPLGPYHGSASLHAADGGLAEMIAEAIPKANGLLAVADGLTGGAFGGMQIEDVPRTEGDTEGGWARDDVEVSFDMGMAGNVLQADLGDDLGFEVRMGDGMKTGEHVDGVVGTAAWTIKGADVSPLADYYPYQHGLTFQVVGVPSDTRCPGGESEWVHD